jgi:hypothetical protein
MGHSEDWTWTASHVGNWIDKGYLFQDLDIGVVCFTDAKMHQERLILQESTLQLSQLIGKLSSD